jgi:hypothetical protein
MNLTLSAIIFGEILLSSIGAPIQPAPILPAHGGPGTNQVTAASPLERLRRRLADRDADPLTLLRQAEWQKQFGSLNEATPTFTVQDGSYQLLVTTPQAGPPLQLSPDDENIVSSSPAPPRVHIAFSYPSAYRTLAEASASLDSFGVAVENNEMAPPVFERPGTSDATGPSAWSDGVSKTETLDGYVPAEAGLRTTPKPNVIIPEPNALVLFAIFGGALWAFSNRRSAAKSAADI